MKQLINTGGQIRQQLLAGLTYTYNDTLNWQPETGIVTKKLINEQKVVLISGGGCGHEPAHVGYIGENMLDCAVMGPIFEPPSSSEILQAIEQTYNGYGTLLIIKNFEKDVKCFLEAERLAKEKGLHISHVIVDDDCSIESGTFEKRRRGVAGTVFVHKILGAAAAEGKTLDELRLLGETVIPLIKTLGVAFSPASPIGLIPQQYELAEDEMYFGIGIHGEPGYRIEKMQSSERIAIELVNKLKQQYAKDELKQAAVLVNGLGGTPSLELAVFMNDVQQLLDIEDITVAYKKMGNFLTAYNTHGLSLTLLNMKDQRWLNYLKTPTDAFGWN
ncbi:dihydroxyacetone kinase subunit DhaK [Enterococcus wangshanyuanii]|uniref:DhaKLM operon coactivator DhaQ n=1 Tax=Enterococcus wangshanyuanii TaxID=2005703 RepID=A0ABQ1PE80_9ENTE|nr:dihydroxyacetone kinase subunit DhaK [Enterococcus wangshanyuanii]GGC95421.1 DhaKLM operon coactivator DhaQ [Enterococcus wangshanyuanii]